MKKNVLLVEDDPALRMVMREVLKDEFEVQEADNGADGIDKGIKFANDLVILDYQLPKKNGLEVIEALKQAHPNLPVIVLTGYLNPQSEAQFNQLGAARIFPKPFNYRTLLEVVRNLTVQQNLESETLDATDKAPIAPTPQSTFPPAPSPTESALLQDSLNAMASLAEKIEFLQSISEKYWIEPNDLVAIRETATCMQSVLQQFYGKMNNTLFDVGAFGSPLLDASNRPCLAGNN